MGESDNTDDTRDDAGQFTEKYPASVFLDALHELGGAGGTADVADEVGCPQRTAYHRLSNLRENGQVDSRQVGGAMLWVVENDG
jgi:hypothetical protein